MKKYTKEISINTLKLVFIRRYKLLFIIFFPIAILVVLITLVILPKSFTSYSTLYNSTGPLSRDQFQILESIIFNQSTFEKTYEALTDESSQYYLMDGTITIKEISNGISLDKFVTGKENINVSFSSPKKTVTRNVLDALVDISVSKVSVSLPYLKVTKTASEPVKTSHETVYLTIGLVAGFIAALSSCFIVEVVSDEIFGEDDIKSFGCSCFVLNTSQKRGK